ncbi:AAA family ATPase [Motiliproteus sp. MSK22-1]|nr:MoxR family ATPase [Motiliproteus sp. MSK22-1]OMH39199.1 AAA family ATPase [Motiliproteus sp. MSK22-1]
MGGSTSTEFSEAPDGAALQRIREVLNQVLIGQGPVVDQVLVALLARGHVLIEGVPGLGKTLLVRSLAATFSGQFSRIQFTPDLMPADVTGHTLFNMAQQKFETRKGPIFTNLLLADEINRAPAKTQAALLEVMQEQQVTIEGSTFPVDTPFMVLATQNPIEQEGTYPLPEAELDRFMLKVQIDYPDQEDEEALVRSVTGLGDAPWGVECIDPILNADQIADLQDQLGEIAVDQEVFTYGVRLCRASRDWDGLERGAGPRASINLIQAARARALLDGRDFVTPDDIKSMALPVLRHRVQLTADREIEGYNADQVLQGLLDTVDAPRQ